MRRRYELISTYDTTTLDSKTAAYLGNLFIAQMAKVALRRLEENEKENG